MEVRRHVDAGENSWWKSLSRDSAALSPSSASDCTVCCSVSAASSKLALHCSISSLSDSDPTGGVMGRSGFKVMILLIFTTLLRT
eukprot:12899746-Prorocentrum_lima.AAC.1